jgi:hypothetical protein
MSGEEISPDRSQEHHPWRVRLYGAAQIAGKGRKAVSERLEELEHGGLFPLGQFAFIDIKGAISQSQRGNQAGLTIPTNPITGGA